MNVTPPGAVAPASGGALAPTPGSGAPDGATYQHLFDANPQPMWVFDRQSLRMLAVNDAAITRYGYSRPEFLALSVHDIRRTPGGERHTAAEAEPALLEAAGEHLPTPWKHACKDGRLLDVEVRTSDVAFDGRGCRLVLVNDLGERVSLERQRRAALVDSATTRRALTHVLGRETDFRELVEQLPALIYQATIDGADRSQYISPYVRTLGLTVDGWRADPQAWSQALHPDDRERTVAELAAAYEGGDEHTAEYRMRDAQGRWRHFRDLSRRIQPVDGSPAYIQGIALDVSDMEASKAALRASEAYRRSLFEQLADGVLLIGPEHQILDANPQALAMLGHPEEPRSSASLQALLVDLMPAGIIETLLENPPGQIRRVEWDIVRGDRTHLPVEVGTRSLGDGRHLAVLRDITERRATHAALLTYQRELSQLTQQLLTQEKNTTQRVAQALHDHLGQTLAVARLNLDLVLATSAEGMPPALSQQCRHIAQLLEQAVLDVRHVLADLRPPMLEEQGLAAALDNETRASPGAAGITDVLLEVGDGLQQQRWPAGVEYSAFMVAREAIVNARLHAQASLIRVVLEGDAGAFTLDVIDDGQGMSPELRDGRPGHLGIVGMRERALSIGARFAVTAAPGGGTLARLRWEAPPP